MPLLLRPYDRLRITASFSSWKVRLSGEVFTSMSAGRGLDKDLLGLVGVELSDSPSNARPPSENTARPEVFPMSGKKDR